MNQPNTHLTKFKKYFRAIRFGLIIFGLTLLMSEGAGYNLLAYAGIGNTMVFGFKMEFVSETVLMVSELADKIKLNFFGRVFKIFAR